MTNLNLIEQTDVSSKPLDEKIVDGTRITALTPDILSGIDDQVRRLFDSIQRDQSKSFGACIAYCIGLSSEDLILLRKQMIESADSLHASSRTEEAYGTVVPLWAAELGGRAVKLFQNDNPIVFSNGDLRDGTIFSIHASSL